MIFFDPRKRYTCEQALKHVWFVGQGGQDDAHLTDVAFTELLKRSEEVLRLEREQGEGAGAGIGELLKRSEEVLLEEKRGGAA